jgi:death on curing protein
LREGWEDLDLADFFLIAEATLDVSADELIRVSQLHLAASALDAPAAEFGGVEFYPDFATKVAVLCSRIVRNHALPDGNKRVGYMCAVEFADRNGFAWDFPAGDERGGEETVRMIDGIAAGEMSEHEFARWVTERLMKRSDEST